MEIKEKYIELKGPDLEPGDIVICEGIKATIKEIPWQEPWSWRDSYYLEFRDTNGVYRSWKQEYDGGSAYRESSKVDKLNRYIIPEEVRNEIEMYFAEKNSLEYYMVSEVQRASNHPEDNYLYMVIARKIDGTYSCWTSYNTTTHCLNYGHYGYSSIEECRKVLDEYYHKI